MLKKKEEFQVGKFIREIEIDEHQHLFWLGVFLILANILLLIAVIYLVIQFMKWYIWILDICVLVFCIVQSVRTYKNAKKIRVYAIHDNCLIVKSLMYDTVIDLSQIYDAKPKKTVYDRLSKKGVRSLALLIKSKSRDKIILRFINEDVEKLAQEILDLANEARLKKQLNLVNLSDGVHTNLDDKNIELNKDKDIQKSDKT